MKRMRCDAMRLRDVDLLFRRSHINCLIKIKREIIIKAKAKENVMWAEGWSSAPETFYDEIIRGWILDCYFHSERRARESYCSISFASRTHFKTRIQRRFQTTGRSLYFRFSVRLILKWKSVIWFLRFGFQPTQGRFGERAFSLIHIFTSEICWIWWTSQIF